MKDTIAIALLMGAMLAVSVLPAYGYEDSKTAESYCTDVAHFAEMRAERIIDARRRGYNGMEAARMYVYTSTLGDIPSFHGVEGRAAMGELMGQVMIAVYTQPITRNWLSFTRRLNMSMYNGCKEGFSEMQ